MGHRNVKAAEMALDRDLNRVVPAVAVSKHDSLLMHKLHVRLHGTQKVLDVHSDGSPYKERAKKVNLDEQRIERWTSRMLSARSTPELHALNVLFMSFMDPCSIYLYQLSDASKLASKSTTGARDYTFLSAASSCP